MRRIASRKELSELLRQVGSKPAYVYLLCWPPSDQSAGPSPFYVGIGRGERLFAHEDEARDQSATGRKVMAIRSIWNQGKDVLRIVESTHDIEPWAREEELINQWGLVKDGTGVLTNEQRYSPSRLDGEAELRKYADIGNRLPDDFKSRNRRLRTGSRRPKSTTSVYGKIYAVLERNPGVSGEALVELLLQVNFSGNKSAYTQTNEVSRPWLAYYIDGGFYAKNQYIAECCVTAPCE